MPGILIRNGALIIDRSKLLYPGDLLHEAGHIAVSLPAERANLTGNITENRPEKEGDEIAVLLWTYAACLKTGIPLQVAFHEDGYKQESQWIIDQFTGKNYIGLPLLVWMGLTQHPENGSGGFPEMIKWLR